MDVQGGSSAPRRPAPPPAPDPAQRASAHSNRDTAAGFRLRILGLTGSSAMNSAAENGVHCLPTHRHCL